MKVLGISIEANKLIFSALENNSNAIPTEISNAVRKLELKNHWDAAEVRAFMEEIHTFLGQHTFDKIAIITRGTKGRFAASPISFKIEGLIQVFPNIEIDFVAPASLRAFYKKNENPVQATYSYQEQSNNLAYYLLSN